MIAVVPMKGESIRVQGKNYRELDGRPLYEYILTTLLEAEFLSQVFVNTESPTLAGRIRKKFGNSLDYYMRDAHLASAATPMTEVIRDFGRSVQFDNLLQTHATSPFLRVATLRRAIEQYNEDCEPNKASLMSVSELRARCFDHHHRPINHDPLVLANTQDLEPILVENSAFYIIPRAMVLAGTRVDERTQHFPIPALESLDIDSEEDWEMVELIAQGLRRRRDEVLGT